jgi:hypothetical protein
MEKCRELWPIKVKLDGDKPQVEPGEAKNEFSTLRRYHEYPTSSSFDPQR